MTTPVSEFLIARQPIFDRHLTTVAYELRFRHLKPSLPYTNIAEVQRALVVLLDIGLDTLVGPRSALVAVPPEELVTLLDVTPFLPTDRLWLAIMPDSALSSRAHDALRLLVQQGCSLLLECPLFPSGDLPALLQDPAWVTLLEMADVVRLSLPSPSDPAFERWLTENVAAFASWRSTGLRLLVTGIEDYRTFARCREFGVDYFQGDFLFRPVLVRRARRSVSPAALMLLARIADPAIDFAEVERLIAQDLDLTYKLLKLVNAVWFARRMRIESLRQALLVLGLRNIAAWVTVIVLAGVERKPLELVRSALVRARLCELLAGALPGVSRESAFLAGLLSVLDAAFDLPLADTLANLPLSSELLDALLFHRGPLGQVLQAILAYERADWSTLMTLPFEPSLLTEAFIDALAFAADVLAALDLGP